ncbi:glutamate-5-semialdehyde dehydrogenase [Acetobacter oeni]|nr:glutamate-5-semialdehyde dehydrogenase [Acetobacter oeni]MBB3882489.1 glutamate-5-semialdehyde dehydrogenase [Acetobacter oeni]NHO18698.1 glutamate-5-semialdehyde dehydrogenase [Acetobacter oeni]GBR05428.1 gamma-glutamyl phosphate reductase [Acetobacter oeni LMG 21952]
MSASMQAEATRPGAIEAMARAARVASRTLAQSPTAIRDKALWAAASALRETRTDLLDANAKDLEAFTGTPAFRDRLTLTPERIEAMAAGLEDMADLPDPVGRILADWSRPNGLKIRRVATPVGVLGVIYESRPNVGADAAGLCIKSGNAVILRGGSESFHSARAIHAAMAAGLRAAGLPEEAVQIAPGTDRRYVAEMLAAAGLIDLIIPRGGRSLVERVQNEARVPVLAHAEGLCHTYIHAAADPKMARSIIANAKMRRPGICGATETLLIDAAIAPSLLPLIVEDLKELGCDFRADDRARAIVPDLKPATPQDFATEWLDATLSVATVDGVDSALEHIARYGSGHTEAIITSDETVATRFLNGTDSAVVMWNASTQFCDGGEFGFGAEIGIATGRIHARGPVGLEQLTTFRYEVLGSGQIRP